MSSKGEFALKYGVYSFLVECARSGVYGGLEEVRGTRLIEVLNYVAYCRSESNVARDEELLNNG